MNNSTKKTKGKNSSSAKKTTKSCNSKSIKFSIRLHSMVQVYLDKRSNTNIISLDNMNVFLIITFIVKYLMILNPIVLLKANQYSPTLSVKVVKAPSYTSHQRILLPKTQGACPSYTRNRKGKISMQI